MVAEVCGAIAILIFRKFRFELGLNNKKQDFNEHIIAH